MMFHTRVKSEALGRRLDAGFYNPEYVGAQSAISRFPIRTMESLRADGAPIGYGVVKPRFQESSVRMVRIQDFSDPFVDLESSASIDPEQMTEFKRSACQAGDLLVAIGGYPGRLGLLPPLPDNVSAVNINQHVVRVRFAAGVERYFVTAFLMSSTGGKILARQVSGSVQAGINVEDFRLITVPIVAAEVQRYIGDKVRQAERLRDRARRLRDSVRASFLVAGFLAAPEPVQRVGRVRWQGLGDRLDAIHYRADLLKNLERIHHYRTLSLGSKKDFGGLGDGDHGNPIYGNGPIYVRATELSGGLLDGATDVRLDEAYAARLPASVWATEEDVMFSIVATLGAVGIAEDGTRAVMSRGVAKVRPLSLPKYYVKAFMRTPTFGLELLRRSVGTIQRGVYLESLQGLEIPLLPTRDIELIAKAEAESDACIAAARRVAAAAKLLVEHLIDGRLNEADLVAAQKALEAGHRSADCEIVKALRQSDAPDAKPLIADVDAVYALLDGLEGQNA